MHKVRAKLSQVYAAFAHRMIGSTTSVDWGTIAL
jgi:hypothetical protein